MGEVTIQSHNVSVTSYRLTSFSITVTSYWARWGLKLPASRLLTQPFIQAQIKENIKAPPRHWPLWGEFTGPSNAENISIWWRHHVVPCPSSPPILNGVNLSSGFRGMRSAKTGPNLRQIWQVFGPWASPYGANGQRTMAVHNYRPRQFHRTSEKKSVKPLQIWVPQVWQPPARPPNRPPARTLTAIPLQPGGLRGEKGKSTYEVNLSLETANMYLLTVSPIRN